MTGTRTENETLARVPQQSRSRASFERMMTAAEALLVERGSDTFTLTEVSKVGKVSIGSIYLRFKSKDELLQAVQGRVMERMENDHGKIIMRARSRGSSVETLVEALVHEVGEFLKSHAGILRPMMLRASSDEIVSQRGRRGYENLMGLVVEELQPHVAAVRHDDPLRAVRAAFNIAYAAFARELGLGSSNEQSNHSDWTRLKDDVGQMAAAFLLARKPYAD